MTLWLAESCSCLEWLGRAPGVSLWNVVVVLTSVSAMGNCHTIKLSFFHMCVCWRSLSDRRICDRCMMGRSQQNSSNDSYRCDTFYFHMYHSKPERIWLEVFFSLLWLQNINQSMVCLSAGLLLTPCMIYMKLFEKCAVWAKEPLNCVASISYGVDAQNSFHFSWHCEKLPLAE